MLDLTAKVALYYFGFGFVIVLLWAIVIHEINTGLTAERAPRFLRNAVIAAAVGLAHPALALSARDVIHQVEPELPGSQRGARTAANAFAGFSVLVMVAVIAFTISA